MSENMELLRMIMENNAGQSPAFILEQYAVYKAGLSEINAKYGTPALTAEAVEALANSSVAGAPVKVEKASPTAGYTKRHLKVKPSEAILEDKIICCICGKEGSTLTERHLATHNGLTRQGYIKLCGYEPDVKLMSREHLKKMQKHVQGAQARRKELRAQANKAGKAGKADDGKKA